MGNFPLWVMLLWLLMIASASSAAVTDCVGAMHAAASPAFLESLQAAPLAPRFFVVPAGESIARGVTADGRDWARVRGRHVYDAARGVNDAFVGAERPCRTAVHERGHQVFILLAFTPGWEELFARIDHGEAARVFPDDPYCRDSKMPQEYFACATQVWCGVYPKKYGTLSPALASVMRTVYGAECRMPSLSESK